jgi:serine/threonine protein kinase
LNDITKKGFGGQGLIYRYKDYVLKCHPDKTILRKLRTIRLKVDNFLTNNPHSQIPKSLKHRSFLIGSGTATNDDLGLSTKCSYSISVFKWLEGEELKNKIGSLTITQRKSITYHLLKGLLFLESIGVVHSDLFPSNFLIRNNIPHFIDLEGAGILSKDRRRWDYSPVVVGTDYPGFGRPPDWENPNQYTDRWYGLNLIFILLTKLSPFFYLSSIDSQNLERLSRIGNKNLQESKNSGRALVWPPRGIQNHPCFSYNQNLDKIRRILSSNQIGKTLTRLCYKTFIIGFKKPTARESFHRISRLVGL